MKVAAISISNPTLPTRAITAGKDLFQHWFNPLHVYCRLRGLGLSKDQAIWISKKWEAFYPA